MGDSLPFPGNLGLWWQAGGWVGLQEVGVGVGKPQGMRNFHRQAEEFGLNLIHPKEIKKTKKTSELRELKKAVL